MMNATAPAIEQGNNRKLFAAQLQRQHKACG
jgi:hypothetical protein